MKVDQLLRRAASLDGQVVCVRGMVEETPIREWSSALGYEMRPLRTGHAEALPVRAVGLLDWSPETGTDGEDYKPDSFDLLLKATSGVLPKSAYALDVTLHAAVMYRRNMFARVPPFSPTTPQIEAMRAARYHVELVVLEIVRCREIGRSAR